MWFSMTIAIGLVVLAVAGYLYVAQKDKPIEDQQRYMMVYEDGLFEVFFGLLLVIGGILLDYYAGMVAILFAVLYPFLLSAKTMITKPRLDPAELSADVAKQRQLSMFVVLGLTLLLGLLAFALFAADLPSVRPLLDLYFMPALIFIFAAIFAFAAYHTGAKRLYLYAIFILVGYLSSFWLPLAFPIYIIALGTGVILVGLNRTIHFIQEHPKLSAGT